MNAMLKIAAIAVIALAVGVAIDPLRPSTPYAATGPSPSPSPSPIPLLPLVDGNLEAGTSYVIDYGSTFPTYPRIVFTAPAAGWLSYNDGNVGKPDHNPLMTPWSARNLMNDPCHSLSGGEFDPPVGPTINDLAAGLVQQGAGTAAAPTDVTVGGYAAKRLELSLPAGLDIATCEGQEGGTFGRWAESNFTGGHLWANGQRNILYIVDVDGVRTLIDTVYLPGTTEADLAEAEQLVASMRFEPIAPIPSPSAGT